MIIENNFVTPPGIFVQLLAEKYNLPLPREEEIHAWLKSHARTSREQEIAWYLTRAATGVLHPREKRAGSLKHILWWLRDHGGELYVPAARAILAYLMEHHEVSLTAVGDALPAIPLAAHLQEIILQGVDKRELASRLQLLQAGRWIVAYNRTSLNLTGIALSLTPAHLYFATSSRGRVIKVRREVTFPLGELLQELKKISPEWVQPYPDMILARGVSQAPQEEQECVMHFLVEMEKRGITPPETTES